MPYEAVSRALAYVSCLSTMSLFATSMAIAAVNVGGLRSVPTCAPSACTASAAKAVGDPFGGSTSKVQIKAVAATPWPAKT